MNEKVHRVPRIHNGERIISPVNAWKIEDPQQKMKLDPYLMPYSNINSK
jgi:hypothetical protein